MTTAPVLTGPKLVPATMMVSPPAVDASPEAELTAGGVYDSVLLVDADSCPPTVRVTLREAPTPAAEVHVTCVFATETVQLVAL